MKIFDYLQNFTGRQKNIVILIGVIREISGMGDNNKDWLDKYTKTSEDIDEGLPETRGRSRSTNAYFESSHAHDQVTKRSVSCVMCFDGSSPISWSSKIRVPSIRPTTSQISVQASWQRKKQLPCGIC